MRPNASFDIKRPDYNSDMGLEDCLRVCEEVLDCLKNMFKMDFLSETSDKKFTEFNTKSTVGVVACCAALMLKFGPVAD